MPKMTSKPKSTSEGIGLSPHAVTKTPSQISAPGSQIGHNPLNPVENKNWNVLVCSYESLWNFPNDLNLLEVAR
jgi:hypothetical protein